MGWVGRSYQTIQDVRNKMGKKWRWGSLSSSGSIFI
jgi:hypothetical protein